MHQTLILISSLALVLVGAYGDPKSASPSDEIGAVDSEAPAPRQKSDPSDDPTI